MTMKSKKHFISVEANELAKKLHAELSLNDKNWHQFKSNSTRRAAELFAGALVQLLEGGNKSDIEALANQGVSWMKGELKDPGCPRH